MGILKAIARFILLMLEGASIIAAFAALITDTFKTSAYESWYRFVVFLCFIMLTAFLDELRKALKGRRREI